MTRHRKNDDITIRMSKEDLQRLGRAARMVTEQRRELVRPGQLAREFIRGGVERILGPAEPQAVAG